MSSREFDLHYHRQASLLLPKIISLEVKELGELRLLAQSLLASGNALIGSATLKGQYQYPSEKGQCLRKCCGDFEGGKITGHMEHKGVVYPCEGCMFQPGMGSMYGSPTAFYVLSGAFFIASAICLSLLFLL